ncbi:MAG: tRNA uridine(34) 5-carboxymethylaminomethyl modification radical SAM/GNAT enzyme Elp3 [Deltaproteobacteria bacterium]|nr:tRNA uridine(34) 5-carboxymethylaminomethyl modification radical SAM/GNAT enzyme Elp3 [Deltaproteobacteria bacterium]
MSSRRHVGPAELEALAESLRRDLVPLERALAAVADLEPPTERGLSKIVRLFPRKDGRVFSKQELILGLGRFGKDLGLEPSFILDKLRGKPIRTQSGVAPVTVLTQPYPCPGRCVFCPNDLRMPKSYLSMEPGAQRAAQNSFDPYSQTLSRIRALAANGHPTDKIELIVLGGTWSSYPLPYQIAFVARCLEAMNLPDDAKQPAPPPDPTQTLPAGTEVDGARIGRGTAYNDLVGLVTAPELAATWPELERAQRANETSRHRAVGLSLETRPDSIDEAAAITLRRLGATKIQLGVESTNDEILALNQRGHTIEQTRRAFTLLRRAGFKIQAHWMPNLLGATPATDFEDFERLFSDEALRPDELKVYPTVLVNSAELRKHADSGAWAPYDDETLVPLLASVLERVPRYCRVSRVIRDIPAHDVVLGTKTANLREVAERHTHRQGRRLVEIRSREIKSSIPSELELRETRYGVSSGAEVFLELVTPGDALAGFLRLFLPSLSSYVDELGGSAIIREVHVYGPVAAFGEHDPAKSQHRGVGRALVAEARARASAEGHERLAVISSVGTRTYYRGLGFEDGVLYQHSGGARDE